MRKGRESASHPTWVRGLKPFIMTTVFPPFYVAPHVGAWIETKSGLSTRGRTSTSHPTWVRGLKRPSCRACKRPGTSHPTWVRGLKPRGGATLLRQGLSHPTWVRGLKPVGFRATCALPPSHPTWVRGLKPRFPQPKPPLPNVAPHVGAWIETQKIGVIRPIPVGRTPRGCVD